MINFKTITFVMLFLLGTQHLSAKTETSKESVGKHSHSIIKDVIVKNSIVKIFTVANEPDFEEPWSSHVSEFSGSGCIIEGDRILTNAHVVTNATYVEVLKNGEIKRYEAKVLNIDHEADLALITVKDKSFFEETNSLEIGGLPTLQTEVNVYGFPTGGETISITKGVVSRIENQDYVNSGKSLLAIQIDAAINPGNSGGPALAEGKIVGLVMQGATYAENMGYIIPTSIIRHFLKDIEDGNYNGYPTVGMRVQTIQSPVMKEMYGLKQNKYGVLVNETIPKSPASRILKVGDIILSVDGHKIFSNAKVEFRSKEFTELSYVFDQHQMGETAYFTILRKGEELNVSCVLDKKSNELVLVKEHVPESKTSYFIYGGLVFVPGISEHYYGIPGKFYKMYPDEERDGLVLLHKILSSSLTKGFNQGGLSVIDRVNGKKFKNFKAFVTLIENCKNKFIVLEDEDHFQMVMNREDVLRDQEKILKRYDINSAKSSDLLKNEKQVNREVKKASEKS